MENLKSISNNIVNENQIQKLSLCGMMNSNISELTQKLESEMPIFFQSCSDLYSRYLHSVQDLFGVCHLAEKQYCEKINNEQHMLEFFDDYFKFLTHMTLSQIDLSQDFLKFYVQFRLSVIDSCDKSLHTFIDAYYKMMYDLFVKN